MTSILRDVDDCLRPSIVHHAALCDYRIRLGSKPIFHLEAFVAKSMSTYRAYLMDIQV